MVKNLNNVRSIATKVDHTCAVLQDGTARCWGKNQNRQLGDGTSSDKIVPVEVTCGCTGQPSTTNLALPDISALSCPGTSPGSKFLNAAAAAAAAVVALQVAPASPAPPTRPCLTTLH
uniref:Uncharacterized protein n=1 Tax=Tetradesmus obliquus TaxID=3088 RepID=A0A383VBW9_TETOB|eukprot:jgi/Sobl393_1/6800/SZX62252.1